MLWLRVFIWLQTFSKPVAGFRPGPIRKNSIYFGADPVYLIQFWFWERFVFSDGISSTNVSSIRFNMALFVNIIPQLCCLLLSGACAVYIRKSLFF